MLIESSHSREDASIKENYHYLNGIFFKLITAQKMSMLWTTYRNLPSFSSGTNNADIWTEQGSFSRSRKLIFFWLSFMKMEETTVILSQILEFRFYNKSAAMMSLLNYKMCELIAVFQLTLVVFTCILFCWPSLEYEIGIHLEPPIFK